MWEYIAKTKEEKESTTIFLDKGKNVVADIYLKSNCKLHDDQLSLPPAISQLLAAEWHLLLRDGGGICSSDPVMQPLCVHCGADPDQKDAGQ